MAALGAAPDNRANLAQQVFGIDLLREMILNHAIRADNGQVVGSSVSTLRLVKKSWLDSITKVLQKSKEPLFNLILTKDNSLVETVGEDEKLLDRFLNTIATKPSLPTFSVKILEDVFVQENHSILSKMLVRFGGGLVKLEMHIPQCGGGLNFVFPTFALQSLRQLNVTLSRLELPGTGTIGIKSNANVTHFLNLLLNAAPALSELVIPPKSLNNPVDPVGFQFFSLPRSITRLELLCYLTSANLELLVESDLPKLTSLKLVIPRNEPYPDDLLCRVLQNCRTTLRQLVLCGSSRVTPRFVTNLRFPVMEKLEEFSSYSIHCELEAGTRSLETLLPKLSRLTLVNQTADMVRKWTQNSNFKSGYQSLRCFLAQENVPVHQPDFMVSVSLEMMQSIHLTFPNVRELDVTVSGTQVCGLKYIFMEMKTLRHLGIVLVGSTVGLDWNFWDALLIGVPIDFVKAFRRSIHFWERGQLTNPSIPSIKNLQELEHLYLETHPRCAHDPSVTEPLISDLTFSLALIQMPKLRKLIFKGKFQASHEMAERWKSRGRKLLQLA